MKYVYSFILLLVVSLLAPPVFINHTNKLSLLYTHILYTGDLPTAKGINISVNS